jgi:hypothetical protein
MKKLFISILILVSIFLLCAARSNQNDITTAQKNSIEKEISKVHEEMKKAGEKLDADTLFKYVLDTNDVIIETGEIRATRKEAYESTKQGFQRIKSLSYTYSHNNINVLSPAVALFTGSGTTTATFEDGLNITIKFAETIIFVLRDGQWKVLHAHRSSTTAN